MEAPAPSAGWRDPHYFYTCLHLASLLIFSPFREGKTQLPSPTSPLNCLQFIKYQTRLCPRLKSPACPSINPESVCHFPWDPDSHPCVCTEVRMLLSKAPVVQQVYRRQHGLAGEMGSFTSECHKGAQRRDFPSSVLSMEPPTQTHLLQMVV